MRSSKTIKKARTRPIIAISHESIGALLKNDASVTHICAFIVISASRKPGTSDSKCGYDAISKCVGIGFEKAKNIVAELMTYEFNGMPLFTSTSTLYEHYVQCVIESPETYDRVEPNGAQNWLRYLEENRQALQKRKKSETRWKDLGFNIFQSIWLKDNFVGNKHSKIKPPVYRLNRRNNNIAAKLLLMMYAWNDLVIDGVFWSAVTMETICSFSGKSLYYGKVAKTDIDLQALGLLFPNEEITDNKTIERMWKAVEDALDMLEDEKFIQKVVVVDIWDSNKSERLCCYDLHVKGERLAGSLRASINTIAKEHVDVLALRADQRSHDGKYYALAPEVSHAELKLVYRLLHAATTSGAKCVSSIRKGFQEMATGWAKNNDGFLC